MYKEGGCLVACEHKLISLEVSTRFLLCYRSRLAKISVVN